MALEVDPTLKPVYDVPTMRSIPVETYTCVIYMNVGAEAIELNQARFQQIDARKHGYKYITHLKDE